MSNSGMGSDVDRLGPFAAPTEKRPRGSKKTWTCSMPGCGNTFVQYESQIADSARPHCSSACAGRHRVLIKFPPSARAEMAERYKRGEHTAQLAKAYSVSRETIRTALLDAGITPDRSRSGHASWVARSQVAPDEGDLEAGFRWCIDCRERKPMADYYWRNNATKKSRQRRCKPCQGPYVRANCDRKATRRKAAYGLTPAQFDRMWLAQEGCCAICRDALDRDAARGVNVDHCHFDQEVRGLLCTRCNTGLGHFRDDPELLWAAAAYLMNGHWHPSLESLAGKVATL